MCIIDLDTLHGQVRVKDIVVSTTVYGMILVS